jgi:4-amino-4-deoxy-L-arabinose transferase-like glycosyltransferase
VSTLTQTTDATAHDRSATSAPADEGRDGTRRRVSFAITLVVLVWSIVELVSLALRHTTGPQLYGVLVAALAVGAAVLSLALLASTRRRLLASIAVLVLWAAVAIGGVAGTVAHIVVPLAGRGLVGIRLPPVGAPLIFTALGLVGGAALLFGQRARLRRVLEPGKG